jgi:hypothetical protein
VQSPGSDASIPKVFWKPRRPNGVTTTAWLRFIPFDPAEIETALGDPDSHRIRDVWTSLSPIEAESAEVAAGRPRRGKLDPEVGEKTGAGGRDFSDFVVEQDVFAGDERIGEIDTETTCQMVVANSGCPERARLTG